MADLKPQDGTPATVDQNLTDEEKLAAIESSSGEGDQAAAADAGGAGGGGADSGVDEDAAVERLSAYMKKKGINDVSRLVEVAENLEKRNTQLDQDVRRLQAAGRIPLGDGVVQPYPGASRPVATVDDGLEIEVPENPMELVTDPSKLKDFGKKLVLAGRDLARREANAERFEVARARVAAKMEANPQEFARLRSTMLELSRSNPNADIDQLYDAAKAIRNEDRKALVDEIRADIGVSGDDAKRLKSVVGRLRQAPISGGTGRQVDLSPEAKKGDQAFLKAIMDSDKY